MNDSDSSEELDGLLVYPQWFDPAFLSVPPGITQRSNLAQDAELWMKSYILFGYRLAISDISVFQSPLCSKLFLDDEFLEFYAEFKDCIQLFGKPMGLEGTSSAFRIGTSAITRMLEQAREFNQDELEEWYLYYIIARTLQDYTQEDFQQQFLNRQGDLQLAAIDRMVTSIILKDSKAHQLVRDKTPYVGAAASLVRFALADHTGAIVNNSVGAPKGLETYDQVIGGSLSLQGANPILESIASKIDQLPREHREFRAKVFPSLGKSTQRSSKQWAEWLAIMYAWNYSVQKSLLGPQGAGSSAIIEGIPVAGTVFEQSRNIMDLGNLPRSLPDGGIVTERFLRVPWHPGHFSWKIILRVLKREEVAFSLKTFRGALSGGDPRDIHLAICNHVDRLTEALYRETNLIKNVKLNPLNSLFVNLMLRFTETVGPIGSAARITTGFYSGTKRRQINDGLNQIVDHISPKETK